MRLKLFLLLTACLVGLSCAQLPTDLLSRNFDVRTELELNAETKIIDMTERHDGTNTHSSVVTILGPDTTKKVKIDNNEAIVFDATDGQCSTIQNAVFVPTVSSGSNDTSGGSSGSTNETQSTKAYYWGLTDILENHDLTAAQQVGDADFRGIPCTLWRINEVTKDNTKYAVNLYTAKNGWQSFGSQNEDSDILVAIQLFGIICAAGENCTLGNITSPSELTGPSFVQTYNFFDLLVLSDDCDTILNIGVLAFCPNSSSSSSNSSSSSSSVEVPKLDTSAIAEVLIVVIHENVTAPQWNGWNFTSDSSSSSSSSSGFSTQNAVLSRTNYGLRNETTFLVDFANNFTATLNSSQCGVVDLSNSTSGDNSTESTPTALPDVTTDFGLPSTVLNSSYARNLLESSSLVIHNVIDLFILGSFQNFTYVSRSFVRGILSDTWISSFSIPVISSGSGSGSGSGNSTDNSTTTSPSSSTGYIMVMSWSVPESDKAAQPIRIRLLSQGTNFSASSSCFTSDLLNGDAESLYETGFQAGFFTNSWLFDIFNYQKGPLCDDALALPAYSSCDFTQISSLNSSSFLPRLPVQFISFISAIDGVNENSTFLQSWYTRQRQLLRFSFYDSNLDLQSAKIIDGTNDSFFTINGSNNVCSPNTLPPSLNVFSNATSNNTNTNGTASNNTSSSVGVFDPSSNAATQDLMVQELVVIFGKFDLVNPIFMGKRLINGILTSFWKGFDNKANITFDLYYQEAASTGGPKTFVPVRLEVYKREDCSSDSSSSSSSTCSTGDSAFICANSVNFSLHRIYNFFGTSVTGVPLNVALPPTCPIPGGGGSASASASVSASASATASGSASASLSSSLSVSASASASASVSASASASASATASAISGSASASASASVSPISASASGVSVSAVSVSASAVSVSAISASSAAALPSASATSSAQISIPLTRRRSLLSTTSESAHSSSHGFNAATVAGIAMSTLLVGAVIGGAFITLRNRRRRTLITEDLDTVALN